MPPDVNESVFEKAISLAKKSTMLQKHGAIIISKNGEILGQGFNTLSNFMSHQWSCHAEISALLSIKNKREKLVDASLLVVRIGNDGEVKLSKPCEKCRKEISKFGIKRVFYST
jgi:deoxycytidylate deaminase